MSKLLYLIPLLLVCCKEKKSESLDKMYEYARKSDTIKKQVEWDTWVHQQRRRLFDQGFKIKQANYIIDSLSKTVYFHGDVPSWYEKEWARDQFIYDSIKKVRDKDDNQH